ncbi:MAG: 4-hydroxyproline epimerase [bacterium]
MTQTSFECIDAHTCGNPVRVVVSNGPALEGHDMSDRRQHFLNQFDWIRTGLMFEPRGHDAMSGSILYPPVTPDGDLSVLFIEVSGCLPMCGHGTIGTVTVVLERGLIEPQTPGVLLLDTPAGRIEARYEQDGEIVSSVTLTNVASFCHTLDAIIEVPQFGKLKMDICYGGNFYAIIEPQPGYEDLSQLSVDDIRRLSPLVRDRLNHKLEVMHPEDTTIRNVSHVMWTGKPRESSSDARNAVFYGDRGIDRSPCGTGTSARMAQLVARGDLEIGQPFIHESIIGSQFTGHAIARTSVGSYNAIVPTISGWARITGDNRISIDTRDPYAHGFLLA